MHFFRVICFDSCFFGVIVFVRDRDINTLKTIDTLSERQENMGQRNILKLPKKKLFLGVKYEKSRVGTYVSVLRVHSSHVSDRT